MKTTAAAKRYAKALLDLSLEKGVVENVQADAKLMLGALEENELVRLLESPIVKVDKKIAVFTELFSSKINALTMGFIAMLATKRRENRLGDILKEFNTLYNTHKNIQKAVVISASGLDEGLRKQVYDLIKNSVKSEVELEEKIDKNLIGGFVLKMGNDQYDTSVLKTLRNLKTQLS